MTGFYWNSYLYIYMGYTFEERNSGWWNDDSLMKWSERNKGIILPPRCRLCIGCTENWRHSRPATFWDSHDEQQIRLLCNCMAWWEAPRPACRCHNKWSTREDQVVQQTPNLLGIRNINWHYFNNHSNLKINELLFLENWIPFQDIFSLNFFFCLGSTLPPLNRAESSKAELHTWVGLRMRSRFGLSIHNCWGWTQFQRTQGNQSARPISIKRNDTS